jgi:thymidylate synthase
MYSLLARLLASQANMIPWEYTHLMGDYHIYSNQVEKVKEQLAREPLPPARVILDVSISSIEEFDHKNILVFYESHEKIVFPHAAV